MTALNVPQLDYDRLPDPTLPRPDLKDTSRMSSEVRNSQHMKTANTDLIKSSVRKKATTVNGHLQHFPQHGNHQQQEHAVQRPEEGTRKEADGSSFSSPKPSVTSRRGTSDPSPTAKRSSSTTGLSTQTPTNLRLSQPRIATPSSQSQDDLNTAIRDKASRTPQSLNDASMSHTDNRTTTLPQPPQDLYTMVKASRAAGQPLDVPRRGHSRLTGTRSEAGDGAEGPPSRGERSQVRFSSDLEYREYKAYREYSSGNHQYAEKEKGDSKDRTQRPSRRHEKPEIKSRMKVLLEKRRGAMDKEEETPAQSEAPRPDFAGMLDVRVRALDMMIRRTFPEEALAARQLLQPRRFRRSQKMDNRWQSTQDQLVLQEVLVRLRAARQRKEAGLKTPPPPPVAGRDNSDAHISSTLTLGARVTPEGQVSDDLFLTETSGSAKTNDRKAEPRNKSQRLSLAAAKRDKTKDSWKNQKDGVQNVDRRLTVTELTTGEAKQRLQDSRADPALLPRNQVLPVVSTKEKFRSESHHDPTQRKNTGNNSVPQKFPSIKTVANGSVVNKRLSTKYVESVSVKQTFPSITNVTREPDDNQHHHTAQDADTLLRSHSGSCLGLEHCHVGKGKWMKQIRSEQWRLKRMSYLNAFAPKIIYYMEQEGTSLASQKSRLLDKAPMLSSNRTTTARSRGKLGHEEASKSDVPAFLPPLVSLSTRTSSRPTTSILNWRIRQKDALFREYYDANSRHVSLVSPIRTTGVETRTEAQEKPVIDSESEQATSPPESLQHITAASENNEEHVVPDVVSKTQSDTEEADGSPAEDLLKADDDTVSETRADESSEKSEEPDGILGPDAEENSQKLPEESGDQDAPVTPQPLSSSPGGGSPAPLPDLLLISREQAGTRSLPALCTKEASRGANQRCRLASKSVSKLKCSPRMSERIADIQRIYTPTRAHKQQARTKGRMKESLRGD